MRKTLTRNLALAALAMALCRPSHALAGPLCPAKAQAMLTTCLWHARSSVEQEKCRLTYQHALLVCGVY